MPGPAVGFIETRGLIGVVEAADAAAKAADIELLGFEQVGGGLVSVRFGGDVSSVQTAVQAGVEAAHRVSEVISHHVMPAPHAGIAGLVRSRPERSPSPSSSATPERTAKPNTPPPELQDIGVPRLRQLVRQAPGAHLRGRQVSRATKGELVAELRRLGQR